MFAGRLEQIAPPAELYERPRTARVAEFVGLSNRLRGVAERGTALVLDVRIPLLAGSTMDGPVTVLVRPEAILLRADAAGPDRVVAASFLGAIARVQVRLADGTLVLAQVPSAEVMHFHHGDAVRVGLKPTPALAIGA
jgi:putative spermidine/putrescine transport system ATP-binding protein